MNWKSIYIVYSSVPIGKGEYIFKNAAISVSYITDLQYGDISVYTDNVKQFRLLSISLPHRDESIEEIHLILAKYVNEFLSRVSFIGYCKAEIVRHLITTIDVCKINVCFPVLSSEISHIRNYRVEIQPADLNDMFDKISSEHYLEFALNTLRKAYSTNSLEEKVLHLYACLERIASEESEEYKEAFCRKCGHKEIQAIKMTKKYIKKLLKNKGIKSSVISNFVDRDRNKIAHGGGKRDIEFYKDLKETILAVQGSISEIVNDRIKFGYVNSLTSIVESPRVLYNFILRTNGVYELDSLGDQIMMLTMAGISKINASSEQAQKNGQIHFGISTDKDNLYLNNKGFQNEFFPKSVEPIQNQGYTYTFVGAKQSVEKFPLKLYLL